MTLLAHIASMSPVSLRLEEYRAARGISQAELARRSGVAQSTISRLEAGKSRSVDFDTLDRLSEALGVNAALLICHQGVNMNTIARRVSYSRDELRQLRTALSGLDTADSQVASAQVLVLSAIQKARLRQTETPARNPALASKR